MKKFYKYLIIPLLINLKISLYANQNTDFSIHNKDLIDRYEDAQNDIQHKRYSAASKKLARLVHASAEFIEPYVLLSVLYHKLGKCRQATKVLDNIITKIKNSKSFHLIYQAAFLYYRCGEYKKGHHILKYLNTKDCLYPQYKERVELLRNNLSFSLKKIKRPIKFKTKRIPKPLNCFAAQYFPIVSLDKQTIIFTGRLDHNLSAEENIYISKIKANGKWSVPKSISKNINSQSNEGACTLSSDGNILIFSAYGRKENIGSCDLYISHRKGKVWSKPKNLGPNINSPGWQSQPSLSSDGTMLFFSSKREGNIGKKDIWMSKKDENGNWSKATNLGPVINSLGIEISPFIHSNGKILFFASNRTPGMGGLDLYYSKLVKGKWKKPKNLGFPINNHKDQVSLFITSDGKKAYYAAGTQKGVHYNGILYEFEMPKEISIFPRCTFIKGLIKLDNITDTPGAKISVFETNKIEPLYEIKVSPENGNFCIPLNEGKKYKIKIQKKHYIPKIIKVDAKNLDEKNDGLNVDVSLTKIIKGKTVIFNSILFEFDKYELNEEGKEELIEISDFLKENKKMIILIEGYTDIKGSKEYNCQLSEKRAKSVYDFLIEQGVIESQLKYEGKGQIKTALDEEVRRLSRKASFTIINY